MNSIYPFEYKLSAVDYKKLASVFHELVQGGGFEYDKAYTDDLLSYFISDLSLSELKRRFDGDELTYTNDFEMLNDPIFNHQYSMIKDYNVNFHGIKNTSTYCDLHSMFEEALLELRVTSSVIKVDYIDTPFESADILNELESRLSELLIRHVSADIAIQTEHNSHVKLVDQSVIIDKHAIVSVIYHKDIIEIASEINEVVDKISQEYQFSYQLLHEHEIELDNLKYFNINSAYQNYNMPLLKAHINTVEEEVMG
ncbi:hypothetical protein [Photobacterium rosenbergii]|uniref:hypothetical protein n=1 Tax=Photobacterium rosenbergii TaxID=294936 RepID=UPI001C99C9CD|nr:hypothetical protein [Photobacterium rosenbergii]MBY5947800.1 hypothetical protein [Photobacterium rosenbergii]